MGGNRPGRTVTDEYLAAILAELRELNARLGRDRPRRVYLEEPGPVRERE